MPRPTKPVLFWNEKSTRKNYCTFEYVNYNHTLKDASVLRGDYLLREGGAIGMVPLGYDFKSKRTLMAYDCIIILNFCNGLGCASKAFNLGRWRPLQIATEFTLMF